MRLLGVFLFGFALRAAIVWSNPAIFGGDTMLRLFDRGHILMGYQLPLLQLLIAGISKVSLDPALVRYMMAAIGGLAGVAFYLLVADFVDEKWAAPAALLFLSNPFLLALATVPYQEVLMLTGLLFAFHWFYNERWLLASLSLAAACLTRYEAWAACPVLAVAFILRKHCGWRGWIKTGLLFGWAPLVWVLVHAGLSPEGHFVVESPISVWRLQRYVYLGWITLRNTQITVLLLAMVGVWRLWNNRVLIDWRFQMQIAFVALFLAALLFSAHGVLPDPERYVTSREATIPIYFVSLLAIFGLAQWPRLLPAIVAASVLLGTAAGWRYVTRETSQPEIQLAYSLAHYLDGSMRDGEHALIFAKPIALEDVRLYLEKARETGGEAGWQRARRELEQVDTPTDYKRVVAHSRLSRDRWLARPAACADWVAVWSDYPAAAAQLAASPAVEVLRSGSMSVTIQRRHCAP